MVLYKTGRKYKDCHFRLLLKFGAGYGMLGTLDTYRFFGTGTVLTNIKKEGEAVVELDQFKSILATYTEPLVEVRDSL